jgi:hypothetical protein
VSIARILRAATAGGAGACLNPSTISGTVDMNLGATTVALKLAGKWVGADCGEYAHKGE